MPEGGPKWIKGFGKAELDPISPEIEQITVIRQTSATKEIGTDPAENLILSRVVS